MKKYFAATVVLMTVLFCYGLDAGAGWIMADKDGSKTYISEGKVKEVSQEAGEPSMIMDYKKKQMLVINPEAKVCAKASFDEYCGVMKQMISAMKEAVKAMGMPAKEQPNVSVKKVGNGGKIAGVDTVKYQVFADGALYEELWLTTNGSLISEIGDLGALEKFTSCLNLGMTSQVEGSPEYGKLLAAGIPVKTISHEDGRSEVSSEMVRIEKKKIPAAEFEAPSGFRKVSIEEALGMGGN